MAMELENSYSTIIGKVKNIDYQMDMITIEMNAGRDDINELSIKIGKGINYIFVRDDKGLLSVDSFKELKLGDDVSIKCKESKDKYEIVEIEKIVKIKELNLQKTLLHLLIKAK
ncbi:type IV secretory system protein [Candidatus Scalindua japonica]|uniref:Type IV secretory system protein n=2 Tax=Candidatus Scalindua japonica TaxID=1284222 RepID=A0A286U3C4_9BACT|nr:type IV secretory system protein [Candidatus Scalindua japonica]